MNDKIKLKYNPQLSVKENALNCGVSEHTIRLYLKMQGIDRRYDSSLIRLKHVKKLQKKGLSAKEISVKVGCCLNTAKKYMKMEASDIVPQASKVSAFIKKGTGVLIKSVSYEQSEILSNILKLHIKQGYFDADFTYSVGKFYAKGIVPKPRLKFDKYPQIEDVLPLAEAQDIKDESLKAVVVDLPFIISPHKWVTNSYMFNRFNSFESDDEAFEANIYMLSLAHRKLAKRGILVLKTMDIKKEGRQIWMCNYVINEATQMGFELIDMFILIARMKMTNRAIEKQKVARKYHSYFLVFKKN